MKTKSGFISSILLIMVALIVLGTLNINIKTVMAGPVVQENLKYASELLVSSVISAKNSLMEYITQHISDLAHPS
jgi:hypothetical protein